MSARVLITAFEHLDASLLDEGITTHDVGLVVGCVLASTIAGSVVGAIDIDVGSAARWPVNSMRSWGAVAPPCQLVHSTACIGGKYGGMCSKYDAITTCDINQLAVEFGSLLRNRTDIRTAVWVPSGGAGGGKFRCSEMCITPRSKPLNL